ncbi:MAG: response regulator transcription factor [Selenomonadaceae bacterium]|nr:response regulator transcription factor [Selenomonadaceae bacterium]
MINVNIAICDNDGIIAEYIKSLILKEEPRANTEIFASAEELENSKINFNIYFLDIKGISGMELARKIREKEKNKTKSVIIFITGYAEYMPEAFDVQAFHYLIKPVDEEKFRRIFKRARTEVQAAKKRDEEYVLLKLDGKHKKIFLKDIFYIESDNKKVAVHTKEEVFKIQGKMEDFEASLSDDFYRVHRCYLVNFAKISSYDKKEIELENGDKILLAQKKYSTFVKAYLAYAKNGGIVNVR